MLDVKERTQAEGKAATLAAIVQSSDDAIISKTLDGIITSWNRGAERLYGYTEQEMVGRSISLLVPPGQENELPGLLARLRRGEHIVPYETRRRRKDGQLIQVSLSLSPVRNAAGQIVAAAAIGRDITAHKHAQETLWQSSQMLQLVLDHMPAFVFWKDRSSVYLGCNRHFATNAGLSAPEQIVGLTDLDLPWKHAEAESYRADDQHVMESGVPKLNYEETQLTADGRVTDVRTSKIPLRDPEGRVIGVLGTFEDITERKRAERLLAEAEAKYRCLVEESLVGVYLIQQGRFVYTNACLARIFGYEPQELLGRTVAELVAPEDRDLVLGNLRKRETGEVQSVHYLFRGLRKDGQVIDVEVLGTSTLYDGQPAILGSLLDITERKRAEQNIALMSFALDNVHEAAFLIDEEGRFHYVNEESCRLLGYTRTELLRLHVADVDRAFPAERWPHHWAELKARRSLSFEGRHRTKAGRVFPVEISANYLEYGGKAYNLALVRDITERKQAEQELKQFASTLEKRVAERTAALEAANKELESFSYSVSHDLRAPLRGIDGFSQLLLRCCAGQLNAEGKSYLQLICSNTQRMGELIDEMLTLSRVSRGDLRQQPVNLSALAREVLDELARREPERKVTVQIAPEALATGDPGFLRIALENLLGNAWKFTSKRPEAHIEFGVSQQEDQRVYFVRDNGAGFDMKEADRLFGVFQRLHSGAEFPGTGVGLATVARVIRRHGGRIWAEARVEAGATFFFTLS